MAWGKPFTFQRRVRENRKERQDQSYSEIHEKYQTFQLHVKHLGLWLYHLGSTGLGNLASPAWLSVTQIASLSGHCLVSMIF